MHVWVQKSSGRARSQWVTDPARLWDMLDYYTRRWMSRAKRSPRVAIHVLSDSGESLLQYVRPATCKRHHWLMSHEDPDNKDRCHYCGAQRKSTKKERERRKRIADAMRINAEAVFADFCRIVSEHEAREHRKD